MNAEITLHCWADERSQYEVGSDEWVATYVDGNGTCILPAGHAGPHIFTPSDEIGITFGDEYGTTQK